jgi:hypothetical protein
VSIAELYDSRKTYYCPKCNHGNQPLSIMYREGLHNFRHTGAFSHQYNCAINAEHLHGWCDQCSYDGLEFAFATRKSQG